MKIILNIYISSIYQINDLKENYFFKHILIAPTTINETRI